MRDARTYATYVERIPPVVHQYGGRYLARGDAVPLSGEWRPDRVILIEFDSPDALRAFVQSPEYDELRPLRESSTVTRAVALPGVDIAYAPS